MNSPKIAVIGCGYWGKNLVRNFQELGHLAMVCEQHLPNQETARSLAPEAALVESFEEVLAADVDGVVIATPAVTHHPLATQALKAGKDVFVEKPLALHREQGEELVALAGDRQILMVGHILEYHPACIAMESLLASGELGDLYYLYSNRLSLGKVRREENILWSFAPHDVAMMNRFVGCMPETVSAVGGNYLQTNVADVTVSHLAYPNGVKAHIHVSWLHPFKEQRLVVIGSQKMAVFNGVKGSLMVYDQRVEWQQGEPIPVRGSGRDIPVAQDEPLKLECQAFIDAIVSRRQPKTDGPSGLAVLSVLEAAQRSLETGETVKLKSLAASANPSA